jgi:hypothetical protein
MGNDLHLQRVVRSGKVSRQDINDLWQKYDANGDGVLCESEVKVFLTDLSVLVCEGRQSQRAFVKEARMRACGLSGKLHRPEFELLLAATLHEHELSLKDTSHSHSHGAGSSASQSERGGVGNHKSHNRHLDASSSIASSLNASSNSNSNERSPHAISSSNSSGNSGGGGGAVSSRRRMKHASVKLLTGDLTWLSPDKDKQSGERERERERERDAAAELTPTSSAKALRMLGADSENHQRIQIPASASSSASSAATYGDDGAVVADYGTLAGSSSFDDERKKSSAGSSSDKKARRKSNRLLSDSMGELALQVRTKTFKIGVLCQPSDAARRYFSQRLASGNALVKQGAFQAYETTHSCASLQAGRQAARCSIGFMFLCEQRPTREADALLAACDGFIILFSLASAAEFRCAPLLLARTINCGSTVLCLPTVMVALIDDDEPLHASGGKKRRRRHSGKGKQKSKHSSSSSGGNADLQISSSSNNSSGDIVRPVTESEAEQLASTLDLPLFFEAPSDNHPPMPASVNQLCTMMFRCQADAVYTADVVDAKSKHMAARLAGRAVNLPASALKQIV